jgi:N-acetylmuramoyl-L-alanine amidase
MPRICIDPGHNNSGADTGAQGNGLCEQDHQFFKPTLTS